MDSAVTTPRPCQHDDICLDVPEFRRLKYFYGQMLGAPDFQSEQAFFRDKMKLHNRCLHGYGVVCGLLVRPVPIPKDCTAAEEAEERQLWQELEQLLAQRAAAPTTAAAAPAAPAPAPPGPAAPPRQRRQPRGRPLAVRPLISTLGSRRCAAGSASSIDSIAVTNRGPRCGSNAG